MPTNQPSKISTSDKKGGGKSKRYYSNARPRRRTNPLSSATHTHARAAPHSPTLAAADTASASPPSPPQSVPADVDRDQGPVAAVRWLLSYLLPAPGLGWLRRGSARLGRWATYSRLISRGRVVS